MAVIVDIADRHAHVVTGEVEPRALADILESAAGQLPIQAIGLALGTAVLQQVDIEQSISVEVKKRSTRAEGLRHEETAQRAGIVNEVEANLVGDIPEPGGAGGLRIDRFRRTVGLWSTGAEHAADHEGPAHEPE